MKRAIFSYLKRKGLTEIQTVNRLFVSAFLRHYGIVPQNNNLILSNYIKDDDECIPILLDFIKQLNKYECDYSLEDLTQLFEFVISPSDRKVTGAVYTPKLIRERIVDEITRGFTPTVLSNKKFADISCGCGGFFLTITQLIHKTTGKTHAQIFHENIFGVDLQEYSIQRTELLLSLLALMNGEDTDFKFNLYQANSLSFDFSEIAPFDFIVGNPPYVCARNMSEDSRKLLDNWSVCASGNSDLYIPFFQIATENLHQGGKMGFITMNSFLSSLNGRALRKYFHEVSFDINIVDFRGYQLFPGRNTYTCLFFLTKEKSNSVGYCVDELAQLPKQFNFRKHDYNELSDFSGWKMNGRSFTEHVESIGTPISTFCQTRHGIATLANNVFVFQPIKINGNTYVFEKNGIRQLVEKSICRRIVNSNKFNSDVRLEDIIEYVIYPYRVNNHGKIEVIDENLMRQHFPYTYKYLTQNRDILSRRDKGHTEKYPTWYAYGRTQSLKMPRFKLFFPKIANKPLHCILCEDEDLLLYNGISFVSNEITTLEVLKRIMESSIFWKYVVLNSKPYSSGYYSLNGFNIKKFGIPKLTGSQMNCLIRMDNTEEVDQWLQNFYK